MKKTMKAVLSILLSLSAGAAMAQSAISQLKLEAGNDAVAASERDQPAPASVSLKPQVGQETVEKLRSAFQALKDNRFHGVLWGRLPLGVRYVSVPLQLMTCPGCVSYTALIPVGALAPNAPVGDPDKATYFILKRSGEWIKDELRYSAAIPMPAGDIFAQCADIDALTVRAWTLPEAVRRAQACLDKTYNRHPFARNIYFVTAEAGKVVVNNCPPGAKCLIGPISVDGIVIAVSGRRLAGDPVIVDIGYAVHKRGAKLLGFHAVLEDKTVVLR